MAAPSGTPHPSQSGQDSIRWTRKNDTTISDPPACNGKSRTAKINPKYRHVAAVHSRQRTSSLSLDSADSPSFLGFKNLMVIVLSKSFLHYEKINAVLMIVVL